MSWKKLLSTSLLAACIALAGLAWLIPANVAAQGGGAACGAGAGQMCRKTCAQECGYMCCDEYYYYYVLDA